MEQNNEERRKALAKKIGIALIAGVIVAPVVWTAVAGITGLVVGGAIALAAIQLAPVVAMKLANLKMKLIVREAQNNPIETMKNIYVENMITIAEKDKKITAFASRLGDFKDKAREFTKEYPDEAPRYNDVASKMGKVLDRQKAKQKSAKLAAQTYKANIDKAEAIYDMACAANAVQQLGGDMEKQVFQDIKKQVAFDSVNHQFNLAVAELTVEADTEPDFNVNVKSLPNDEVGNYSRPNETVEVSQ